MKTVFFAAMALALCACAPQITPAPKSADFYMTEGDQFYEQQRYDDAIASWEKVRDNFYSPEMTAEAEFKIGEAYYLDERYAEAVPALEGFLQAHPGHGRTARALYLLGNAYHKQALSEDRDTTAVVNAKITFEKFLAQFPQNDVEDEVRAAIVDCEQRLAGHELYVGRFYLRTENYSAAEGRLTALLNTYPDFARQDEAYYYLGLSLLEQDRRQDAVDVFNNLYRAFPASRFVLKAQKIMEKRY